MSITRIEPPTSRLLFGMGRCDITPPVGIYHRFWGAALHDQATGVHKPLTATVMLLNSLTADADTPHVLIAIDHCLFRPPEMDEVLDATSRLTGVERSRIIFAFSHTHSGGHVSLDRSHLPGGDLIGPYLDGLPDKLAAAFREAEQSTAAATFTYASADCSMGHNRDYWDEESQQFVCGFNPEDRQSFPTKAIRVSDGNGQLRATIVNYPCHPTTLAWENTLISPDYVGALRELVEAETGVPCVFLNAPCGDIGPEIGFVGDTEIADRNGRQVAYAALSALQSMPPANQAFQYQGPVLSGATLGDWRFEPMSAERLAETSVLRHHAEQVEFAYLPAVPTVADAERELADLESQEAAAQSAGNDDETRRVRALAERARRLLDRIRPLPQSETYPLALDVWQLGDAFWVAVEGEPYYALQEQLQTRFPDRTIIVMPLANGARCCYLPTREAYDKPLYQVDVAPLAPGCLEALTDAAAARIEAMLAGE